MFYYEVQTLQIYYIFLKNVITFLYLFNYFYFYIY